MILWNWSTPIDILLFVLLWLYTAFPTSLLTWFAFAGSYLLYSYLFLLAFSGPAVRFLFVFLALLLLNLNIYAIKLIIIYLWIGCFSHLAWWLTLRVHLLCRFFMDSKYRLFILVSNHLMAKRSLIECLYLNLLLHLKWNLYWDLMILLH